MTHVSYNEQLESMVKTEITWWEKAHMSMCHCAENIDWPCLLYSKGYSDIDINTLGARKIFDNYINLPDLILDSFTNYNYKN